MKNQSIPPEEEKEILARIRRDIAERKSPKQPVRESAEGTKAARTKQQCLEGLDKYLKHQRAQDRREKAESILDGGREELHIAKPGEFVVVQTAEKSRPALWGARESLRSASRRRGNTGSGARRRPGLSGARHRASLDARPEDSGRGDRSGSNRGLISSRTN